MKSKNIKVILLNVIKENFPNLYSSQFMVEIDNRYISKQIEFSEMNKRVVVTYYPDRALSMKEYGISCGFVGHSSIFCERQFRESPYIKSLPIDIDKVNS